MPPSMNRKIPSPNLPPVGNMILDHPLWTYRAGDRGRGSAMLRVWVSQVDGGYLAVVTELGTGLSITNGAEYIYAALEPRFPGVVVFEHYPAEQSFRGVETLDQVRIVNGKPTWVPVWPVPEKNPNYVTNHLWISLYGEMIAPRFAA